jgi:hypothetical protein
MTGTNGKVFLIEVVSTPLCSAIAALEPRPRAQLSQRRVSVLFVNASIPNLLSRVWHVLRIRDDAGWTLRIILTGGSHGPL